MPRSLLLSLRIRRRWQSNEGVGAAPLAVFRQGHGRQKPCSCFRFISFFKDFIWYVPHLMARANALYRRGAFSVRERAVPAWRAPASTNLPNVLKCEIPGIRILSASDVVFS